MHASARPLVSVCIPAYNDSAVVVDALRSAILQDYAPLEIVVVDNHSTDGTWETVTAIASGDSRVRVLRNSENIGMARNFNACIAAAGGEYVLILCADDLLEVGAVELLASALQEHPRAVFSACGRYFTDISLRKRQLRRARSRKEEVGSEQLLRECFARGNRIGEPSAVMFRRVAGLRGFHPDYSQAIDLEMWFHLLKSGSAALLPDPRCLIRQHAEQTTQSNIRSGRIVRDKQLLFRQYSARLEPILTLFDKIAWDARMASSVARTRAGGGTIEVGTLAELFYPKFFSLLLYPVIALGWRLRDAFPDYRL